MKIKWLFVGLMILFLHSNVALAYNPYGEIYSYEVYYNDNLLSDIEVAKPTLEINEPFTVRVDFTVYQKCEVSIMLTEIGKNNYVILEGPTQKIGVYGGDVMEINDTTIYEWAVAPTDNWAGGTLPLDFVYQINDINTGEILVNSRFTIVRPYITTEYYEGDTTPTTTTDPESPTSTDDPTTPSTPAFTLLAAALALTIAARRS
jgi:sarcinarray family protein